MEWSGINNRWRAAFGQKKPNETSMTAEQRQELESTISLLTKMNRLDQLLEIIREHRETYDELWLVQAELSVVRQLNVADFEATEEPYEPLSDTAQDDWPELEATDESEAIPSRHIEVPPTENIQQPRHVVLPKKFSLDCDDEEDLDESQFNEPEAITDEIDDDEIEEHEKDADRPAMEFDPDDVIEEIGSFEDDDDPSVWREELDPDWQDMVSEADQPAESLTRVERSVRARQVASELIAKHDWPHEALPILAEIFNKKSYGAAKVALDRLMSQGLTLQTLVMASHIRAIWHESPAYWISFNKAGDEAYDTQYLLSWPGAINLLNAFTDMPSIEEVEIFLEDQLDYWMHCRSLRLSFRSFRLYLWFRTSVLQGTLPPDEPRNFDRLPYEDGVEIT